MLRLQLNHVGKRDPDINNQGTDLVLCIISGDVHHWSYIVLAKFIWYISSNVLEDLSVFRVVFPICPMLIALAPQLNFSSDNLNAFS